MPVYAYWFIAACALLGLEMATGTFYLLVLAIATTVGGVFAALGLDTPVQFIGSAIAGVLGIIALRRWRGKQAATESNQSFDIGHPVRVISWREDGTARVHYRGAEWDAELEAAAPESARTATLYIKTIRGSVLILSAHKPN
ncbi:MAG: NfeD family protein [Pseudomonadota bacterium]